MLFVPTVSLNLVLGTMSLLVLLTAFSKHFISQVVGSCSRDLVMVQVWHWYVSVWTKMELMILLLPPLGCRGVSYWDKLVAYIVGLLYPVFNFPAHSTFFCEYTAKIFKSFDLLEICVIDVYVEGAWCPADLHCLSLVDTDLHVVLLACGV